VLQSKRAVAPLVVSRIKVMSKLDIAEKRLPQDGRISLRVAGRAVDVRVSTIPAGHGERVVLRLLDKQAGRLELNSLGMDPRTQKQMDELIHKPHGILLVTGPTGSGKTTTLYATLSEINTPEKTLISIEDPIEYELQGIKQVQVNAKAGLDFASGLRSMVRADPDVLMVGEIRDRETAQNAMESSLTGHLVLSTLHTGDAPTAPARLVEMGIEPFLIASGIHCVVGQRLARRLCDECKTPVVISAEELQRSDFDADTDINAFEPGGCVRCNGSGFRGRIGIYEVMMISEEIRALILKRSSNTEITAAANENGMRGMRQDGLEKIRDGVTSVPEVLRALGG